MTISQPDEPARPAPATVGRPSRSLAAPVQDRPRRPRAETRIPDNVRDLPQHITVIDGQRLRDARSTHRISRERLAWKSTIAISTIESLERRPAGPRLCRSRTLVRLATALGEPPAALAPDGMAAALGLEPAAPDSPTRDAASTPQDTMSA